MNNLLGIENFSMQLMKQIGAADDYEDLVGSALQTAKKISKLWGNEDGNLPGPINLDDVPIEQVYLFQNHILSGTGDDWVILRLNETAKPNLETFLTAYADRSLNLAKELRLKK